MLRRLEGREVALLDGELLRREGANRDYLMRLSSDNLLLNYRLEAGRPTENYGALPQNIHGGWEFPTCQLRGHFLGHWLSAAAVHYRETGDIELKAKADAIVNELAKCQEDNGGEWAASIPEKYFDWIGRGKNVWAPHYTVHKTFTGLIDMYRYAGSEQALQIADRFADWFVRYSGRFTREEFDNVLDFETGGMLEVWASLLELTGKEKYRVLLERYYRGRLFDRLLAGEDPLTNMHANTTIPEAIGCAKAYEVTGEEKWRQIALAYWKCAVTERGSFVTGGQTLGEVWTPKKNLSARLGDRNQEHCTVYNMIRLASFLYSWTGDAAYADYIEKNLYNGIMAQAYWQGGLSHGLDDGHPHNGLVTYFLPMRAGGRKGWASETEDFFCCHGTMIQANSALNRGLYYRDGDALYICQYFDSEAKLTVSGTDVKVVQREDRLTGSFHLSSTSPERQSISSITSEVAGHPDRKTVYFAVKTARPVRMRLLFRVPSWAAGAPSFALNGVPADLSTDGGYAEADREWQDGDTVMVSFAKEVRMERLPGDDELWAFTYGPEALAALGSETPVIRIDPEHPGDVLVHDTEREWGAWHDRFRTRGQEHTVRFVPIREIGYEPYAVYFRAAEP